MNALSRLFSNLRFRRPHARASRFRPLNCLRLPTHLIAGEKLEQKQLLAVDVTSPFANQNLAAAGATMSTINVHPTGHLAEEGRSTLLLTFLRDNTIGSETFSFALSGTATPGEDYYDIGDSITFADGQGVASIVVNPKADFLSDDSETIICTIDPSANYAIGPNASAELVIRDAGYIGDGFAAPLDETFSLHSKPDAEHTVYLDFFGGNYYTYNTILKYNTDGDSAGFSSTELHEIQRIWAGIAEDFAPFDVNVTTELPEAGALINTGAGDTTWGVSLLIGEQTTGYGFAWSGSEFYTDTDFPGYVSIDNSSSGGYWPLDLIAAGGSHEIGHTMGLSHDGPGGGGYYSGHSTDVGHWNPIMGQSNSGLTQWSKGEYANATNLEDDLSVIASELNGIDYIADDHADAIGFATPLVSLDDEYSTLYGRGIIHQAADVDWFTFSHAGGPIVLNVDVAAFSPNLHAGAWLYDANGSEVFSSTSTSSLSAPVIAENLPTGTYYLKVDGIGNTTGGGYSDYGSLGHYTVSTGAAVLADFSPNGELANVAVSGTSQLSSVTLSPLSSKGFSGAWWTNAWALYWLGSESIDPDQYISFSITPNETNKALAAETILASFYSYVSGSTDFVLRTSQDNFQADIATQTIAGNNGTADTLVFDVSGLALIEELTEFRIYSRGGGAGNRYLTGNGWSFGAPGEGLSLTGRLIDTTPVNPNNNLPSGTVVIVGEAAEDQILSADPSAITDPDGLGNFVFQWTADGVPLSGETGQTLTLTQNHVGKEIRVSVSFVDGLNTRETVTSAATAAILNVNDDPTGTVSISGKLRAQSELTVDLSQLSDEDGIVGSSFSYQWLRNNQEIIGASQSSYTLTDLDVNTFISVRVLFQDSYSGSESVDSAQTTAIQEALPSPVLLAHYLPDFQDADGVISATTTDPGLVVSSLSSENHFGSGIDNVWALFWDGGSQNLSEYIGFTVTPSGPDQLYADRVTALMRSEAAGDTTLMLRSSLDNFANDVGSVVLSANSTALVEFDLSGLPVIEGAVEFRIYAMGGGAAYRQLVGADFSMSDSDEGLAFYGSIAPDQTSNAIDLSVSTIPENFATGALVGDFSTTTATAGGTFTYTLAAGVGDTANALFEIVGNQLRTLEVLDFETSSSHSIRVRSTDAGGVVVEKPFTITVTDVNENPTAVALTATTVAENAGIGTSVAVLSTSDPDAGESFAYSLIQGDGDTDNGSFELVGDELRTREVFDYEVKGAYFIRVKSTDAGGLSVAKEFTITVTDVNEQPSFAAIENLQITEDAGEQSVLVAGISSGDHVSQNLKILASSSNPSLIPSIAVTYESPNATATIAFTPALNQYGTATITVTAEDGGTDGDLATIDDNATFSRTFDVTVTPVNDVPTLVALPDLLIEEDSSVQQIRLTGISAGANEQQLTQISVNTSNTDLVSNYSLSHLADLGQDIWLLAFSPSRDRYGVTTLTVTVEDAGNDNDLETTADNLTFSRSFTVTVTPDGDENDTPIQPVSRMFVHESTSVDSLASYRLTALNGFGEPLNGLQARIVPTSSNTGLIPNPTVLHSASSAPEAIAFSPNVGAYGTSIITLSVEDGGDDNVLATTGDNRTATHQVEVTVLKVLAEGESATLASDGEDNLYANTLPVTLDGQQTGTTINGFAAFGVESSDTGNSVLVRRAGAEYRLVSENTWEIIGMFDSLRNRTRRTLDMESRGIAHIAPISVVAGAFEVAGQQAPDIIVRRNQTYVFDLNVAGHPFYLQTTGGGYVEANVYTGGFDGNGHTFGRHEWVVPADAPAELFYQSGLDDQVFGKIIVVD